MLDSTDKIIGVVVDTDAHALAVCAAGRAAYYAVGSCGRRAVIGEMWGELADYYPPEECLPKLTSLWEAAKTIWVALILEAEDHAASGRETEARVALEAAATCERAWGDDPTTRVITAYLLDAGLLADAHGDA